MIHMYMLIVQKKTQKFATNVLKKNYTSSNLVSLYQLTSVKESLLLNLFSKFEANETSRKFKYVCLFAPSKCHFASQSFGGEHKAKGEMKQHLSQHLKELLDTHDTVAKQREVFLETAQGRSRRLECELSLGSSLVKASLHGKRKLGRPKKLVIQEVKNGANMSKIDEDKENDGVNYKISVAHDHEYLMDERVASETSSQTFVPSHFLLESGSDHKRNISSHSKAKQESPKISGVGGLSPQSLRITGKFVGQSQVERDKALKILESLQYNSESLASLQCKICDPPRSFTAPSTLLSHYKSHAGIRPFECQVCGAVFTRQHSLKYHMLIHANQTRFMCDFCGRRFRHPSHFKEHLRKHTGETPFHCPECLCKFKTRNTFKRHVITRHGKRLTADGCLITLTLSELEAVRMSSRKKSRRASNPLRILKSSGLKQQQSKFEEPISEELKHAPSVSECWQNLPGACQQDSVTVTSNNLLHVPVEDSVIECQPASNFIEINSEDVSVLSELPKVEDPFSVPDKIIEVVKYMPSSEASETLKGVSSDSVPKLFFIDNPIGNLVTPFNDKKFYIIRPCTT